MRPERNHMDSLAQRIACRHTIRVAVLQATQGTSTIRTASALDRDMIVACLEVATLNTSLEKTAGLGTLVTKARKIWETVKKAPKLWEKLKEALGVESFQDLPKAFKEWGQKGLGVMRKLVDKMRSTFPISLYIASKSKMPSLTDLLGRVVAANPKLEAALKAVNTKVLMPLDQWIEKNAPNLTRPLKAAVFIWVWLNVAEISWDMKSLMDGFTGAISFGELFASLPESGIGAVLAVLGVGYHLLPVSILARIVWMVGKNLISWKNGSLVIHWEKITGDPKMSDERLALA